MIEEELARAGERIGDSHLALRIGIGDRLGAAVAGRADQSALGIVAEVLMGAAGIRDRGQGVLLGGALPDAIGIACDPAVVILYGNQMLVGGVVGEVGLAAVRIGDLSDSSCGVVANRQDLAGGMGQADEQATRVTAGDTVAVGIFDVIELAVRAEGVQQAIRFPQSERPAADRTQHAVVAGLCEVTAVAAVGQESAAGTARTGNGHRLVGSLAQRELPIVRPPMPQRSQLVTLRDRLCEAASKRQRQPRRLHRCVHGASQRASRAKAIGLQKLEGQQVADFDNVLSDPAQVSGVVVEHGHIVAPGRADLGREIGPNWLPSRRADRGGPHAVFQRGPIDGRGIVDREHAQAELDLRIVEVPGPLDPGEIDGHAKRFPRLQQAWRGAAGEELDRVAESRRIGRGPEPRHQARLVERHLGFVGSTQDQQRRRHGHLARIGVFHVNGTHGVAADIAGHNKVRLQHGLIARDHLKSIGQQRRVSVRLPDVDRIGSDRNGVGREGCRDLGKRVHFDLLGRVMRPAGGDQLDCCRGVKAGPLQGQGRRRRRAVTLWRHLFQHQPGDCSQQRVVGGRKERIVVHQEVPASRCCGRNDDPLIGGGQVGVPIIVGIAGGQ